MNHRERVVPGMVDAHVHSCSDQQETFEHAKSAVTAGGMKTIVAMPNDKIGNI